ncbi:MAG: hypothetical protein ACFB9N_00005 [Geitlerinemataceae cyanobacterium]
MGYKPAGETKYVVSEYEPPKPPPPKEPPIWPLVLFLIVAVLIVPNINPGVIVKGGECYGGLCDLIPGEN